eukprot:487462-Rhodomonas_salina.1
MCIRDSAEGADLVVHGAHTRVHQAQGHGTTPSYRPPPTALLHSPTALLHSPTALLLVPYYTLRSPYYYHPLARRYLTGTSLSSYEADSTTPPPPPSFTLPPLSHPPPPSSPLPSLSSSSSLLRSPLFLSLRPPSVTVYG